MQEKNALFVDPSQTKQKQGKKNAGTFIFKKKRKEGLKFKEHTSE